MYLDLGHCVFNTQKVLFEELQLFSYRYQLNFDIAQAPTDSAKPNDPNLKRVATGKYNKQKCPILTNTGSNLSQLYPGSELNTQTDSNLNPELRRSKRIPAAKRTDRYGAINYF